jgi:hypothetical protein
VDGRSRTDQERDKQRLSISRILPPLEWARDYNRGILASDSLAAIIVTIMLIPQ